MSANERNGSNHAVKDASFDELLDAMFSKVPIDKLEATLEKMKSREGQESLVRETPEVKRYVESVEKNVISTLVALHKLMDAEAEGKAVSPLSYAKIEEQLNKLSLTNYKQSALNTPYEPIVGRGRKPQNAEAATAPAQEKAPKAGTKDFEEWKRRKEEAQAAAPAQTGRRRGRPAGTTRAVMEARRAAEAEASASAGA